jgi:hypothetical protein
MASGSYLQRRVCCCRITYRLVPEEPHNRNTTKYCDLFCMPFQEYLLLYVGMKIKFNEVT